MSNDPDNHALIMLGAANLRSASIEMIVRYTECDEGMAETLYDTIHHIGFMFGKVMGIEEALERMGIEFSMEVKGKYVPEEQMIEMLSTGDIGLEITQTMDYDTSETPD